MFFNMLREKNIPDNTNLDVFVGEVTGHQPLEVWKNYKEKQILFLCLILISCSDFWISDFNLLNLNRRSSATTFGIVLAKYKITIKTKET